jgi:mono/diheme cytochrome c family protein
MKAWIKWTAGGIAAVVLLASLTVAVGLELGERKKTRKVDVQVVPVAYVSDTLALQRGKYLFESRGCAECHGAAGTGREFENNHKDVRLAAPDITSGGATAKYRPEDWVRTIRHGVKPNGNPLLVMPAEDYNRLTDDDFAALVGYVRTLPPGKGSQAVIELPLPARVLYGLGAIPDAAGKIDHSLPPAKPVPVAINAQHGAYVANMCMGCHGEHFSGGKIAGGPPDWPPAANLTPGEGSVLGRYPDAGKFVAMLRSGKRPDGSAISVMPFDTLSKLDDTDARAVYEFLKTLPARAPGSH